MKREFWAEFDAYSERQKRNLIEYFLGKHQNAPSNHWGHIEDLFARQQILAEFIASEDKCDGRTKCKDYAKGKNGLQWWYYAGDSQNPRGDFQTFLCQRLRWMGRILGLRDCEQVVGEDFPNLSIFPPGSWAVQITFTLKKPYISRDDTDFYILDNPVKKEWVFKVSYVASSQWKGALRSAMRRLMGYATWKEEARDAQMVRLFGNVKGEVVDFSVGRLYFYPTFFDRIGMEVIIPHDRETGAGKNPIYLECVPAGTAGIFMLLYVPLTEVEEESSQSDLEVVAKSIKAMLTEYGFGGKTSSGYGVAEVDKNQIDVQPSDLRKTFIKRWEE